MRPGFLSGQRLSSADEQREEEHTVWRAGQMREALDAAETEDAEVSGPCTIICIYTFCTICIYSVYLPFSGFILSLVGA